MAFNSRNSGILYSRILILVYRFVIVERKFVSKRKGSAFVRWAIGEEERVSLVARASESALVGVGGGRFAMGGRRRKPKPPRRWRGSRC